MNQNQNDATANNPQAINMDERYSVVVSRKELELLFKYISRADLKGAEVPELNRVIATFDPKNLTKL
jgi:hypothetical protein